MGGQILRNSAAPESTDAGGRQSGCGLPGGEMEVGPHTRPAPLLEPSFQSSALEGARTPGRKRDHGCRARRSVPHAGSVQSESARSTHAPACKGAAHAPHRPEKRYASVAILGTPGASSRESANPPAAPVLRAPLRPAIAQMQIRHNQGLRNGQQQRSGSMRQHSGQN